MKKKWWEKILAKLSWFGIFYFLFILLFGAFGNPSVTEKRDIIIIIPQWIHVIGAGGFVVWFFNMLLSGE